MKKLFIKLNAQNSIEVEVDDEIDVKTLKNILANTTKTPINKQTITVDGVELTDGPIPTNGQLKWNNQEMVLMPVEAEERPFAKAVVKGEPSKLLQELKAFYLENKVDTSFFSTLFNDPHKLILAAQTVKQMYCYMKQVMPGSPAFIIANQTLTWLESTLLESMGTDVEKAEIRFLKEQEAITIMLIEERNLQEQIDALKTIITKREEACTDLPETYKKIEQGKIRKLSEKFDELKAKIEDLTQTISERNEALKASRAASASSIQSAP